MRGSELRDWMERKRWSVTRLSAEVGVTTTTMHRYLNGSVRIPKMLELALEGLERRDERG